MSLSNLTAHQTIIFPAVTLNNGNGYNSSDGTFTCPVGGVYVFTWTTMVTPGQYLRTDLVVNDVIQGLGYADAYFLSNATDSGTSVVVTQLERGDVVRVRVSYPPGTGELFGWHYSTFSGWRVSS
jgi:hypothetical protein